MSESKIITVNIYGQDYMLKSEADEEYINKIGLWHSIAHDKAIDENFVADLKLKIEKKYSNFKE